MKAQENTKNFITEQKLKNLKDIQDQNTAIYNAFAQLKVDQLTLEDREEQLENYYRQIQKSSTDLGKQLDEKYGKGSVNLETGEFTPAE